jgi:opacity protein-like surface antigen
MQTRHLVLALIAGAALNAAGAASAQVMSKALSAGPYFRVEAGYAWGRDAELRDENSSLGVICGNAACSVPGKLNDIGNSSVFGAAIGYRVHPKIRAELALGYRPGFELDDADAHAPPTSFKADIRSLNVMLNGYYDFDAAGPWKPFVSAGVGYARNKLKTIAATNPGAGTANLANFSMAGDTEGSFAWSLGVGASYAYTNRVSLELAYRYVDLGNIKVPPQTINFIGFGPSQYGGAKGDLSAHEVVLGLRF